MAHEANPASRPAATKQRVEIAPQPKGLALAAPGTPVTGVAVVKTATGDVTVLDRAKAYYHTIFAAVSAVAVLVVEVGPDLGAIPGISDPWRHWITVAVVVANAILTGAKSN